MYSSLITYNRDTLKRSKRAQEIIGITPHHAAGVYKTGADLANYFYNTQRSASANYCIGNDGSMAGCVPEEFRAWTTSSSWNDQRRITIEVSNSKAGEPWQISQAAYNSLVKLCADIAKRYNLGKVYYDGTKNAPITEHRMFAATVCPGTTIHGYLTSARLAKDINKMNETEEKTWTIDGLDFSPVFDPEYYDKRYPEIREAKLNTPELLFLHFEKCGMKEARQACVSFDVKKYRKAFTDLEKAFDDDWEAYFRHYIMYGKDEVDKGLRIQFM